VADGERSASAIPEMPRVIQAVLPEPGFAILGDAPPVHGIMRQVQAHLVALGFAKHALPLAELHCHVPTDAMALSEHYTNAVSRAFYTPEPAIQRAYHALIAYLARELIPWDFLFQAHPIIRFHFPVPFPDTMRTSEGNPRQLHSDLLGGHPPQMLQGWAALTDCAGSAALQCAPREASLALLQRYRENLGPEDPPFADSLAHFYASWDRLPHFGADLQAACQPVPMKAGALLFFDPHCLHGGAENTEATTRVSLDFRLLPVEHEAAVLAEATTPTAQRFQRGDIFYKRTAQEVGQSCPTQRHPQATNTTSE